MENSANVTDDSSISIDVPDQTIESGRLIGGKYRLGRLLGEGGMGSVYEAEHIGLGTQVAVKLLSESFASDVRAVSRFRREARAAAAIRHDNVVSVFDTGTDEQGVPFIVMERLTGESLSAYIRRERILPLELATTIACQILAGLSVAHANGIIHRDLKPGNVILAKRPDNSYAVKILDFGISKFFSPEATAEVTVDGAVVGTPRFMAPEQARGISDLDARLDIYAVGVLIYRMVTGKLPFSGSTQREVISRVLEGKLIPPRTIEPTIPDPLEKVIVKALAADRRHRFETAEEFIAAIQEAMPQIGAGGVIPIALPVGSDELDDGNAAGQYNSIPSLVPVNPAIAETVTFEQPLNETSPLGSGFRLRTTSMRLLASTLGIGLLLLAMLAVWKRPNSNSQSNAPAKDLVAQHGSPIKFGVTRYLPKDGLTRELQPLVTYLSRQLKRSVELTVVEDYLDLSGRLASGKVQLAALAPYAYVRATRNVSGLNLLATPVTQDGTTYEGYVMTREDSGIKGLNELRGKIFCYVNPHSASGYLYPRALLRRIGIDPDRAFAATRLTGDHVAALKALYAGACDAAAVFAGALDKVDSHEIPPDSFRVLASTGRIPYDAYCAAPNQSQRSVRAFRKALLALKPNSGKSLEVLGKHSRIHGFAQVRDADYEPVRRIERYLDGHSK